MSPLVRQTAFLVAFYGFILASRIWARERWFRHGEAERQRRAALEREWRVGIPYDLDERPRT